MTKESYKFKKQQKTLERKEKEKERKMRILRSIGTWALGVFIVVGILGVLGFFAIREGSREVGEAIPIQGAEHIQPGSAPPYEHNSNPPTSGWHYPTPAKPGIYDKPIEDGYLVHSLEHGYVLISYNNLSQEEIHTLEEFAKSNRLFKLIVVPRPQLADARYALTAWGRLLKLNEFHKDAVSEFIDIYRNKGPERTME